MIVGFERGDDKRTSKRWTKHNASTTKKYPTSQNSDNCVSKMDFFFFSPQKSTLEPCQSEYSD